MALKAQHATGNKEIAVLADRGYFNGDQVLSCEGTGVAPIVPKTLTSSGAKRGFFHPAGLHLRRRTTTTTPARRGQNSPRPIAGRIKHRRLRLLTAT